MTSRDDFGRLRRGMSLIETVMALVLGGLVMASVIIPVSSALITFQKAEATRTTLAASDFAATRIEQVAQSVWRDASPPAGFAPLSTAAAKQIRTADWRVVFSKSAISSRRGSGAAVTLASPTKGFALRYLNQAGKWVNSASGAALRSTVAVTFHWVDSAVGNAIDGLCLFPDRQFQASALTLPKPNPTGKKYRRADYARTFAL